MSHTTNEKLVLSALFIFLFLILGLLINQVVQPVIIDSTTNYVITDKHINDIHESYIVVVGADPPICVPEEDVITHYYFTLNSTKIVDIGHRAYSEHLVGDVAILNHEHQGPFHMDSWSFPK